MGASSTKGNDSDTLEYSHGSYAVRVDNREGRLFENDLQIYCIVLACL